MKVIENPDHPLSEEWLKSVGFKWDQLDRQPTKHWTLWLGNAVDDNTRMADSSDIGVELATRSVYDDGSWHCWLRSDVAHRYCRFIHVRVLRTRRDLMEVIFGLTGREFDPDDCFYGSFLSHDRANRARAEAKRFDMLLLQTSAPWNDVEADEHRGRPRQEHTIEHDRALAERRATR